MIGTCIQMFLDSFLNSSLVAECEHSVQQAIAASASEVCVTKSKSFEVAPVVRPLQKSADVFTRCFTSFLGGTKVASRPRFRLPGSTVPVVFARQGEDKGRCVQ